MPSFSPASRIVSCALIWAVLGATPSAASPSSAQAATVPAANPAGFGGFWSNYDVSRDGREFLMLKPEKTEDNTKVTLVINWLAAVQK